MYNCYFISKMSLMGYSFYWKKNIKWLHFDVSLHRFLMSNIKKILCQQILIFFFFLRFYLFYFLERGRERDREGAKHQCVVTSHMTPSGNLAHNLDMCPRLGTEPGTLCFIGRHSTTEQPSQGEFNIFQDFSQFTFSIKWN